MAVYTESIREYLQKRATQPLTNLPYLEQLSERELFAGQTFVSDKYKTPFVLGFTMHFFNDEFGLETFPLWQMALWEKLYNNADYINTIYDSLDKQVFSEYRVHRADGSSKKTSEANGTLNDTRTDTKTLDLTRTDDFTNTANGTDTHGGTEKTDGTDSRKDTGTVTGEHSDTSNEKNDSTRTVNLSDAKTLDLINQRTDNLTETHALTDSNTGSDKVQDGGTDSGTTGSITTNTQTTTRTYTDYDVWQDGSVTMTPTGAKETHFGTNDKNGNDSLMSDTPQNGLQSLEDIKNGKYLTQATVNSGTSILDQTTTERYLENYNEKNDTDMHTKTSGSYADSITGGPDVKGKYENIYGKTQTTTHGLSTSHTGDVTNTGDVTTTDKGTDTTLHTGTDGTVGSAGKEASGTNSETRDLNSAGTNSSTVTKDLTDTTSRTETNGGTSKNTGTESNDSIGNQLTSNKANENGETHDESIDYTLNMEMLLKSQSLLTKVWDIFEDIFMGIY